MEYSFYHLNTGVFEPGYRQLPDAIDPAGHAPAGHGVWRGRVDSTRWRVVYRPDDHGDAYPVLEAYQPPAPADDEWQIWSWDADAWRWLSSPTPVALARTARTRRAALLAACDWIVARSAEWGEPVPDAWANYRQALRNVPDQPGFPADINWPQEPA
jgi:hypothetical protein